MDLSRKLQLLDDQVDAAKDGNPTDFTQWRDKTAVVIRTVLGEDSTIYRSFKAVRYQPGIYTERTDFGPYRQRGVQQVVSLLNAAKLELSLVAEGEKEILTNEVEEIIQVGDKGAVEANGRIFIVHGHDEAKKYQLARFVERLTGLEPVILHEQANKGAVLIQKLEASAASTGFAVVLLTADDLGRAKLDPNEKPRGRQNVIFEMGFFIGALGRAKVAVLMEPGVEEPGDVTGLVYTPLDAAGAWQMTLAREFDAAGIPVRWEALR